MRQSERTPVDVEFPSRYALDEARFSGGHEHICNEEERHEPPTRHA